MESLLFLFISFFRYFQSKLEVIETQSDRGLSGSVAKLEVGVASMHAMEARLKLGGQATVYLDTPKGLLIAWSVEGPKHQAHMPHPDRSHSIAPFHKKSHLLKTVSRIFCISIWITFGRRKSNSYNKMITLTRIFVLFKYNWADNI